MKPIELAEKLNACSGPGSATEFVSQFETIEEAWNACSRGDWMLWLAKRLGVDIRVLTLAKGLCANTVRHLMTDPRSIAAVDAAISFGRGEIDRKELAAAAYAAYTAAYTADTYAADAAAYAADAYIAYTAAYAAAAARKTNRQQTADICREVLTGAVFAALSAAERMGK